MGKEDKMQQTIEMVSVEEANAAPRMMTVSMDGLVEIYDFGVYKGERRGFSFVTIPTSRSKKPQWFRLRQKLTVEMLEHSDPLQIGMFIQDQYRKLKSMIEKWEQYGIMEDR